jgi:hypothetical protein
VPAATSDPPPTGAAGMSAMAPFTRTPAAQIVCLKALEITTPCTVMVAGVCDCDERHSTRHGDEGQSQPNNGFHEIPFFKQFSKFCGGVLIALSTHQTGVWPTGFLSLLGLHSSETVPNRRSSRLSEPLRRRGAHKKGRFFGRHTMLTFGDVQPVTSRCPPFLLLCLCQSPRRTST